MLVPYSDPIEISLYFTDMLFQMPTGILYLSMESIPILFIRLL